MIESIYAALLEHLDMLDMFYFVGEWVKTVFFEFF